MLIINEMLTLYWSRVREICRASFSGTFKTIEMIMNSWPETIVTEIPPFVGRFIVMPISLPVVFLIEATLLMFNIAVLQPIQVMIAFGSRKPVCVSKRDEIILKLKSIRDNESQFDRFIAMFSDNANLYQSSKSKGLITSLCKIVESEEKKFLQEELEKIYNKLYPSKIGTFTTRFKDYIYNYHCNTNIEDERELLLFCMRFHAPLAGGMFPADKKIDVGYGIKYDFNTSKQSELDAFFTQHKNEQWRLCYEFKEYVLPAEKMNVCRDRQLKAIQQYLTDPDNNGKKLMQFIHTNLSDNMNGSDRKHILVSKAEIEINRLKQMATSSSLKKADQIKEALSDLGQSLDENKLSKSLLIHRGFFKSMPDSYTNVYCTDTPSIKR